MVLGSAPAPDQRSDEIESVDEIARRTQPALQYFPPQRTRAKLRGLVAAATRLRTVGTGAASM